MPYKKGEERHQTTLFPASIDEYVAKDSPVRLFDVFVDKLDLATLGFQRTVAAIEGRPAYAPSDMLKLYVYGYFYQVRSSRRLERECRCNIEVMWLLRKLTPDFRTIAGFRKDNPEAMEKVFREFNRFCLAAKIMSRSYISIDGSKFQAVNSSDRNYNQKKIDEQIQKLSEHISLYMAELDKSDETESSSLSKEKVQKKLNKATQQKENLEDLSKKMKDEGKQQLSITDGDSKQMSTRKGFIVGYNTQTAVDADSHMIVDFDHTQDPVDLGHLTSMATKAREVLIEGDESPILSAVCDTGYESQSDQAEALANGIIPNVIRRNREKTTEVSYEYHEADIDEQTKASTKPEDLRKCLEAGVVPDAYREILTDMQIHKEYQGGKWQNVCDEDVTKMTPEQMREKAKDGYFIRNAEANCVYCPQGCTLYPCGKGNRELIPYRNKAACNMCKNKCLAVKYHPQPSFSKDVLVRPVKWKDFAAGQAKKAIPKTKTDKQRVSYTFHLDIEKMKKRMAISEHPFGTIKRALGQYYFLTKGLVKTRAEMAMSCLSYNLRRAIQLRGVENLVSILATI